MKTEKIAILLISDIHYSQNGKGSQIKKDDGNSFWSKFKLYLDNIHKKTRLKYIIITGDITDEADPREYKQIKKYLIDFCEEFSIERKNIMILPGNHDVNRAHLQDYCMSNDIEDSKASNCHEEKLKYFKEFYDDFFQTEKIFDPQKAIIDIVNISEVNAKIIGVNSLFAESYRSEDHYGDINLQKLEYELKELSLDDDSFNILAIHHSLSDTQEKEVASIKNPRVVKEFLNKYRISTYIYGHHHTSASKLDEEGDDGISRRYIELGTLGKILSNNDGESYTNRFSIMFPEKNELLLKDYSFSAGEWGEINTNTYMHSIKTCNITNKKDIHIDEKNMPDTKVSEINLAEESHAIRDDIEINNDSNFFLLELIKEKGYYREGHFHWQNGSKTLGWINVNAILGEISVLYVIQDTIIKFHKSFPEIDVAIGYGMEGNIICSSMARYWIEKNIPYYYYPSIHKEKGHINVEKDLWNEFSKFKNILLIFDFMPSDAYLQEIVDSTDEFKNCEVINIVSLFYNRNILKNQSKHMINKKISRYALAEFNVNGCEYNENECPIFTREIKTIHKL